MDNDFFYEDPLDTPTRDNTPQKTWILLAIVWLLCLLPIPFTTITAAVLNFAALIMAITVLVRGYIRHGILQLLSVFLLTPAFFVSGIFISAVWISHTLDTGTLSRQTLQEAVVGGLNDEAARLYKIAGKDNKSDNILQDSLNSIKQDIPKLIPGQSSQEKEQIITLYVAHTRDGGKISCLDIVNKGNILTLKTKSGMDIEIPKDSILKIERYQTVGGKTKKAVWNPAKQ